MHLETPSFMAAANLDLPIWILGQRIVRFAGSRYNEFASKAG